MAVDNLKTTPVVKQRIFLKEQVLLNLISTNLVNFIQHLWPFWIRTISIWPNISICKSEYEVINWN